MKYWPDRSSSATQFAFLRDPEPGGASRFQSVPQPRCLKKSASVIVIRPPALLVAMKKLLMSYPHPRQPTTSDFIIPTQTDGQAGWSWGCVLVIVARSCEAGGRLRQRHGLIVKGKRISCPPHYAPPNNDYDPPHHDYEHGFPLIRSLRASTQR